MSFGLRARRAVAVLAGLLIASVVPLAKASAAESRSLPVLLPLTVASSRMGMELVATNTGSTSAKDSDKYFAADSKPSTAQEGEIGTSAPPRPVTAEQKAANPPKVSYAEGQLTIIAENSLLSDILSALHTAMETEIDLPASAASERIWVRLGPGPARKIVSELLSGTDLNFVIQGSATDADGIQSVLLTPHSEPGPGNPGISSQPQERMANRRPASGNPTAVEAPEQEPPIAAEATVSAETTPPSTGSPRLAPQSEAASVLPAVEESIAHPSPPSSMTSEAIRQQLLSMYQQRRQLQQNQPSTPANAHP